MLLLQRDNEKREEGKREGEANTMKLVLYLKTNGMDEIMLNSTLVPYYCEKYGIEQ